MSENKNNDILTQWGDYAGCDPAVTEYIFFSVPLIKKYVQ